MREGASPSGDRILDMGSIPFHLMSDSFRIALSLLWDLAFLDLALEQDRVLLLALNQR